MGSITNTSWGCGARATGLVSRSRARACARVELGRRLGQWVAWLPCCTHPLLQLSSRLPPPRCCFPLRKQNTKRTQSQQEELHDRRRVADGDADGAGLGHGCVGMQEVERLHGAATEGDRSFQNPKSNQGGSLQGYVAEVPEDWARVGTHILAGLGEAEEQRLLGVSQVTMHNTSD